MAKATQHSAVEREARRVAMLSVMDMYKERGFTGAFVPIELSVKESQVVYSSESSSVGVRIIDKRTSLFTFRFEGGICTKVHIEGTTSLYLEVLKTTTWKVKEIIVYLTPNSPFGGPSGWIIDESTLEREFEKPILILFQ